jgi:hypothetical protein
MHLDCGVCGIGVYNSLSPIAASLPKRCWVVCIRSNRKKYVHSGTPLTVRLTQLRAEGCVLRLDNDHDPQCAGYTPRSETNVTHFDRVKPINLYVELMALVKIVI